eukprot:TRINITY_DN4778_c0_g1_i3.p1 TRINITY_DN4778_c0_g1~~TRINITY_DN4778_c0_g1_i3.p1  ORF type:complete len:176 (+),score=56.88 TRINITY_DN4778_c0_g1_i3:3-530(+)
MSTELLNRLDDSRADQRLRDQMDRLDSMSKMDTMYPTALSRHKSDCSSPQSYKRAVKKKVDRRGRFRTQPITFMEIKEVDEEMSEDLTKSDTSEDKTKSDLNLIKKSSKVSRSHSCRKADSGSRKKLNKQNGSLEDVVSPGDEDELLDVVGDHLQNVSISMKCQRGFSTRPIPSI